MIDIINKKGLAILMTCLGSPHISVGKGERETFLLIFTPRELSGGQSYKIHALGTTHKNVFGNTFYHIHNFIRLVRNLEIWVQGAHILGVF